MDKDKKRHAAGAPQISFETFCQGRLSFPQFFVSLWSHLPDNQVSPVFEAHAHAARKSVSHHQPQQLSLLDSRLLAYPPQPCFHLQHDQPQPSTFAITLLLQGFNYSGVNLVKYLIESVYPRCLTFILACSHATAVTGKRHSLVIGTIFVVFCGTSVCDVCHKFMLIY